jgi:hypothetical protein
MRRTRDAQHVSERAQGHVGPKRELDSLVDHLGRGHADRAARAVHKGDAGGQQLVQPELDDGMRLAAADLHHRPRAGHGAGDGARKAPDRRRRRGIRRCTSWRSPGRCGRGLEPFQLAHGAEVPEGLLGLVRVDHSDRDADVHQHVIADRRASGAQARLTSLMTPPKLTRPHRSSGSLPRTSSNFPGTARHMAGVRGAGRR